MRQEQEDQTLPRPVAMIAKLADWIHDKGDVETASDVAQAAAMLNRHIEEREEKSKSSGTPTSR